MSPHSPTNPRNISATELLTNPGSSLVLALHLPLDHDNDMVEFYSQSHKPSVVCTITKKGNGKGPARPQDDEVNARQQQT
ncbi:hypothetical protein FRC12_014297 [Ceratobasidium sp. 428]|nr:hypothetical protein FRC12_014297 [Ceratobasidium sp. 428]